MNFFDKHKTQYVHNQFDIEQLGLLKKGGSILDAERESQSHKTYYQEIVYFSQYLDKYTTDDVQTIGNESIFCDVVEEGCSFDTIKL